MTYELTAAERPSSRVVTEPDGQQRIVLTRFGKFSQLGAIAVVLLALSALALRAIGVLSALLH
jgi:hypothetical protein